MRSQKDLSTSGNLCLGPQPITGACNLAAVQLLSLAERAQPQLLASVGGVTKSLSSFVFFTPRGSLLRCLTILVLLYFNII